MMQIAIYGAVISSIYALLAVGFTLIFGVARILNLAHGAFYALGAYGVYALTAHARLPLWLAAIVAVLAVGGLGILIRTRSCRPRRRKRPPSSRRRCRRSMRRPQWWSGRNGRRCGCGATAPAPLA